MDDSFVSIIGSDFIQGEIPLTLALALRGGRGGWGRTIHVLFYAPIKRHLVKRKNYPLESISIFYTSRLREAVIMTGPRSPSAPLPDFLPFDFSKQSLLYHAPIRIKVFDFHRTRENEQRVGLPKPQSLFSARFHESPLSATADPENDRFQAVSKGKRQLSWFRVPAFQWLTAWSVKTEISDL